MLDGEVRLLLDLMEKAEKDGRPKLHTLPYAEGRAAVDKMSEDSEADPPKVAATIDGTIPVPGAELKVRRYRPLGVEGPLEGRGLPTLIYYHGGGWVIGNIETHDSTCRRIANKSRC
jgi:acetyl esterase